MSEIKIKSVELSGFRSFKDNALIEFPDTGMILVSGQDLRTGGSSGSGKTSIFEAIFFNLGVNRLPATELKNHQSESIKVTVKLEKDNNIYEITRSSAKLSMKKNDIPVEGMKSEIESKIQEIIGDPEIFEAFTYRVQGDRGLFLHREDSKLKSFLVKCMPELEKVESEYDKSVELINKTKRSLELLEAQMMTLNQEREKDFDIKSKESRISENAVLVDNKSRELEELSNINPNLVTKSNEDLQKEEQINQSIKSLEDSIQDERGKLTTTTAFSELNLLIGEVDKKLNECVRAKTRIPQLVTTFNQYKESLIKLEEDKCPTCSKDWDKAQFKKEEIKKQIESIKSEVLNLNAIVGAEDSTLKQKEHYKTQLEGLKEVNKKYELSIMKTEGDIRNLRLQLRNINSDVENKNLASKRELEYRIVQKKMEISQLKAETESTQSSIGRFKAKELSIQNKESEIKAEQDKLVFEQSIAKVLGREGLLGKIFDGLLSEVEKSSNEMLTNIPNCSDISIQISSSQETKSQSIKSRISTRIYKNGSEINFKTLSGGQKCALSLCTDLAMINAIKNRTNIKPGFIALDEAMDGLDSTSKLAAIELIKQNIGSDLILIIDHSVDIADYFDYHLKVTFDGQTSLAVLEV